MQPLTGPAVAEAFELHRRLGDAGAPVDRRKVARACLTAAGRARLGRAIQAATLRPPREAVGARLPRPRPRAARSTPRASAAAQRPGRGPTQAPGRPARTGRPAGGEA